jgi:cytochrome c5
MPSERHSSYPRYAIRPIWVYLRPQNLPCPESPRATAMSQVPSDTPHDKHFFDTFMLVLGILVGVTVVLIFLARAVAAKTQNLNVLEDAAVIKATEERLAPVAKLAISGADNSALEAPKPQVQAAVEMAGDQAYGTACAACHGTGIAGAPKFGDKAAWGPRLAQGIQTLYQHALQGYQGKAGVMPAKGGRVDFSDKTVTAAVDHMVSAVK